MRKPVVLIVDDDADVRELLKVILADHYELVCVENGPDAISIVKSEQIEMALMDLNLPGMDGLEALEKIKEINPECGVVVISATDKADKAVSALKLGAYDYITKPFDGDELIVRLKRFTDRLSLKREVTYLREELENQLGYGELISKAPRMMKVFELIKKVAPTSSNVLVSGESGTGKELVSRAIHALGPRKDHPFVAVNCGAIPSELIESELFGHVKGSFTGASANKIGKFEFADNGTIFLDEVATLPPGLQVKLLRVLQERTFERVGSNQEIKVDIRVIAATNVDLEEEVQNGTFRDDLYYRLKVVPVDLPPLRERTEDIPLLVESFIQRHSRNCNKQIKGISPSALKVLCDYYWPGNIRELENLVERLVVLATDDSELIYDDLPVEIIIPGTAAERRAFEVRDYREACRAFERHYITDILEKVGWNRIEAARLMNVHRNTLTQKIKSLGIANSKD